ncbi:hypothetical protein RchiOBHm_Chr5g0047681 [Rosa chinensis]|uniref:Uncharacterized protein n=1 Tax=Rosa chinensis TaxID=74649 RepID=A0A2P6QEG3_ROSCH|nr:hypothetical protein RchiOBHm_Chr5g0047681 [Rosa chinensis]
MPNFENRVSLILKLFNHKLFWVNSSASSNGSKLSPGCNGSMNASSSSLAMWWPSTAPTRTICVAQLRRITIQQINKTDGKDEYTPENWVKRPCPSSSHS